MPNQNNTKAIMEKSQLKGMKTQTAFGRLQINLELFENYKVFTRKLHLLEIDLIILLSSGDPTFPSFLFEICLLFKKRIITSGKNQSLTKR